MKRRLRLCAVGAAMLCLAAPRSIFPQSFDSPRVYLAGSYYHYPPFYLAVGDFNGDGKPDLAAAPAGDSVRILLNDGHGNFEPRSEYVVGNAPTGMATGDFDRDGKLDLAVVSYYGSVSILLGYGDGTFHAPVYYPAGHVLQSIAIADFNGEAIRTSRWPLPSPSWSFWATATARSNCRCLTR